mmetsp:Transcript_9273/g.22778  ORF Transcript_9273/g.22778 Transcript_9273/m.22778 type:complete len:136 (-) Transcript_9273:700-1107(-)
MEGAAADIGGAPQGPRGPPAWLEIGKEAEVPVRRVESAKPTNYQVRVLAHRGGQLAAVSKGGRKQGRGACGATPFEVQINWIKTDGRTCDATNDAMTFFLDSTVPYSTATSGSSTGASAGRVPSPQQSDRMKTPR